MVYSENGENGNRSVNNFGNAFNNALDNRNGTMLNDPEHGGAYMADNNHSEYNNDLFIYLPDGGYEKRDRNGELTDHAASRPANGDVGTSNKKGGLRNRLIKPADHDQYYNGNDEKQEKKHGKLDGKMNKKLVMLLVSYVALIAIIIVMVSLSNYLKSNRAPSLDMSTKANASGEETIVENVDPFYFGKTAIVIEADTQEPVVVSEPKEDVEEYKNAFDKFCDAFDKLFGGR